MKKILLILLFPALLFGQAAVKTYSYGDWISYEEETVRVVNTDTDTVFFSFRTITPTAAVASDTNTTTYDPPDVVYWSGNGTIEVIPTYVTSDAETDSLEIYVYALDPDGGIMASQKIWLDFTVGVGDWQTSQCVTNWTSTAKYNASIGGAFSACFGIAVFVSQHAADTGQSADIKVRFIRN